MASPRVHARRLLLAATAIPVLLTGPGLLAAPASAAPVTNAVTAGTTDRAEAAAGWLATQLEEGTFLPLFPGFPDTGLTIDAMLAFAAAGVGAGTEADMLAWLTQPDVVDGYTGIAFSGGYTAGETAKVIYGIQVAGGDPTDVNGVDLVAKLLELQQPSGLFQNPDPAVADDTNTFDQTLAILALARTSGGVPAAAVGFLVAAQCADHSFPGSFGNPSSCGAVDSTAIAVQALLAANHPELAQSAVSWLGGEQNPTSGAFDDGGLQPENTNSTGLAAQALRAFGQDAKADLAVAFLTSQQVGCTGADTDRGGIAYQPTDPNDPGNTGFQLFNAPRATTQAILGLVGVPFGELSIAGAGPDLPRLDCTVPPATTLPATAPPTPEPILAVTGVRTGPIAVTGAALLLGGVIVLIGLRLRRRAASAGDASGGRG
jgi:hypothetical protein